MGQEDSKPELITRLSPRLRSQSMTSLVKQSTISSKSHFRIESQGILKLRRTPFINCIQIQRQSEKLFLQNVQITLKTLIESRLNTNKLFLIEDVAFTLAHLQQNQITYKDVHPQNIYYDKGNFKLLPNQLITQSTYERLKDQEEVFPSPELIIALRCQEEDVSDQDILEKSNIFTFGMILLEVCTLLPSSQCYSSNYDILDAVINERIVLVQEYYGEKIAKIIANMLDYDYTQRLNLKKLSIWLNGELQQPSRLTVMDNNVQHFQPTTMIASKTESTPQPKVTHLTSINQTKDKSRIKPIKNNSVYMGRNNEGDQLKEQRNKIYINQPQVIAQKTDYRHYYDETQKNLLANRKKDILNTQNYFRHSQNQPENNLSFSDMDSFKGAEIQPKAPQYHNPYAYDCRPSKENKYQKQLLSKDTVTRRKGKEPFNNPYRNPKEAQSRKQSEEYTEQSEEMYHNSLKTPLKDAGNKFYPKVQDLIKTKEGQQFSIRGPLGQNGYIHRIKSQIQKSRKLIEDLKRAEDYKF